MEVSNGRGEEGRRKVKPEGGKETRIRRETERGGERMGGSKDRWGHLGLAGDVTAHDGVGEGDVDEAAAQIWTVPDGGWGWVVVLSAMMISLIVDGLSYTFGLFLGEFERTFNQPKSTVALASSLQVGVYLFVGPVVSALTNRFGCRSVIVTGSCLSGLAFVASSRSTDVTMLILTYGLLAGVGFGLMYLPSIVAVSVYFEKRRALATGIAVCGTGIGTFLMAPIIDYLLQEYNWRGTLLILAGIVLNGAVFGALIRPLRLQRGEPCPDPAVQGNGESRKCLKNDQKGGITKTPYNGLLKKEGVPLISLTGREDNLTVTISPGVGGTSPNPPHGLFFSSTPAMTLNQNSILSKVELEKGIIEIFPSLSPMKPGAPPRRRTQSSSDHTQRAIVGRARSHAPIGLALISLSDVNLQQIRHDVNLPLSRRDIHLSGPLTFQESDATVDRADVGMGLYIQSVKSIASLSAVDGVDVMERRTTGLWSCLPQSARETMEEMLDLGILKDKRLWCVLMGNFLCMLGIYVPFVYLPERAIQLGISEEKAAILVSVIGITNTVGRVMAGVLINFLSLDSAVVTSCALVTFGVTTVICPFCHSYPALAVVSAIYGICMAAYISLCSVLLCELFGVDRLTNAFGFVILFRGIACMMGPPIAGAIIDATGLFDPSFYVAGGVIVLGGLSHALLLAPCSRRSGSSSGI